MFFLLYKRADDAVFDDFPKISDHFPKISEDFPKLIRRSDERFRTFSKHFRTFSEDYRQLTKIAEGTEDVSIIHQQILVQLKGQARNVVKHDFLTVLFFLNWTVCLF